MASAILHIKDSFYFEVPKAFWRQYSSLDQVPKFLKDAHPNATLDEFNSQLAGKLIIPQPFANLKNLYEKEDGSGFAISKFMILEVVVAALLIFLFSRLAARMRSGHIPRGRSWNLAESMLVFIRDQVARPAIGHHDADRFLPLLWTMFFFILFCNLGGMIPWLGAPTSAFGVTLAMAGVTFLTVLLSGIFKFGPIGFWFNQVPHMELPLLLQPLKLGIFVIEVFGMCIKHLILGVRLLANMVAGHLVLLAIMTMAFSIEGARSSTWGITAVIAVLGSTAFSMLELFVALLQAYVFTFLSALFIGSAVHHH